MRRSALLFALSCLFAGSVSSQDDSDRLIRFPNIPGYLTLKCDLHIHTVFSDGSVWPDIRVQEAMRDGLDAISLTEHLEYQPHDEDIPHPDRNRSFEIATELAQGSDLLILHGAEITRRMPPGHSNAVLIQDANKLLLDEPVDVFREAKDQGAFSFWNHPHWVGQRRDGVATLTDMHRQLIEAGLLHGIEVVNGTSVSEEALQIALEHDLTILGTSDVHGLVDWLFDVPGGGHRAITLVLATERSADGIRDALFAGRTIAWFEDLLIGKEELLVPLIGASLQVRRATYPGDDLSVLDLEIENRSSASFVLANKSGYTFYNSGDVLSIAPHSSIRLGVKTRQRETVIRLELEVLSALVAPKTHPRLALTVEVQ